jgi:hypothetical protein
MGYLYEILSYYDPYAVIIFTNVLLTNLMDLMLVLTLINSTYMSPEPAVNPYKDQEKGQIEEETKNQDFIDKHRHHEMSDL